VAGDQRPQGRPLILTIAFVGDEASSFVLVNRKGVKVRELTLQEMAEGLHEGQITLLDDFDLPLMERASQRMIENMHSQLAYQASHDDLTQLMNRKEFEREVGKAIQSARARDRQHALLYLDLDQFKIVNNTSGHTAGDELLKLIADTLVKSLADEPAKVARLGGDEFGVLAENIGTPRRATWRSSSSMRSAQSDSSGTAACTPCRPAWAWCSSTRPPRASTGHAVRRRGLLRRQGRRPQPRSGVRAGRHGDPQPPRHHGVGDPARPRAQRRPAAAQLSAHRADQRRRSRPPRTSRFC
jgi:diguanylate cyclase (GGDEF)-like protein